MIRSKFIYFVFVILLFTAVQVQFGEQKSVPTEAVNPGEDIAAPIHVTFKNDSGYSIQVHILSYDMITSTYTVEPKKELGIDVEYGQGVRLEYPTCPNRTDLRQMGALNELNRTVLIRDDRDTVFIEEKFSGQRVKGNGNLRIPEVLISEPQMECQQMKTQKADIDRPGNTGNKKAGEKVKPTRKEDPGQPVNKTEKNKKKKE